MTAHVWTTPITYAPGFANRVTATIANQQWRDNLNYLYRLPVRKTSDQTVTSSTTLVSDTVLKIPLAANEDWEFELALFYDGAAAGDIKIAWNVPSGATGVWGCLGADPTTITSLKTTFDNAFGDATTQQFGANGAGVKMAIFVDGIVLNSTTAGDLQLRWAQGTSSATATSVFSGSYLLGHRL